MKASRRYIPVLITLALASLIGLQIVWLFSVYKYKRQELKDKTREAVLETAERLEKEENARLIIHSMDSLLVTDEAISPGAKEEISVIVSDIKKLRMDSFTGDRTSEREVRIINDTSATTTVVKINGGKKRRVIVHSGSYARSNPKRKAKELESLFLRMAVSAKDARRNISSRVDSHAVRTVLKDELLKRGIDLPPEFGVFYAPDKRRAGQIAYHVVCNTKGYQDILPAMVTMPLFAGDVLGGDLLLKVGYLATGNFLIRQMAGMAALSLFITLLIGSVMIYIFRRMLSQEKLHQMKNDFINNMTHELKTPIATISLALDAIGNPLVKNDPDRFNDYTRILKEENKKLDSHVERVLQMALLEKGELRLSRQQVDLITLIRTSLDTYKLQIEEQKAQVHFIPPSERITVTGDELHLQTVFNNLLDNALKYSAANCVISIHIEKKEHEVQVSFKDNGIGMDPAQQERIFDKFYRAQGGNLHDVKGFGLGLSYVRSIVEAHGGSITVKSEKGKGSEFVVLLKAT